VIYPEKAGHRYVSMELCFSNISDAWLALNNLLCNSHETCSILKEVVCSCNMLDFFVRCTILAGRAM